MSYSLIIFPSAEKEIQEAFNWYEDHKEGLGEKFVRAIHRQIKQVISSPEIYQIKIAITGKLILRFFLMLLFLS